jgi:hypothetical protein
VSRSWGDAGGPAASSELHRPIIYPGFVRVALPLVCLRTGTSSGTTTMSWDHAHGTAADDQDRSG